VVTPQVDAALRYPLGGAKSITQVGVGIPLNKITGSLHLDDLSKSALVVTVGQLDQPM